MMKHNNQLRVLYLAFVAQLSLRLTRSAYSIPIDLSSVCLCVSTLSKINISATSGPIATKIYLKHHWGRVKAALGFGLDRIRTLVSMATYSSHRVIMGNILSTL